MPDIVIEAISKTLGGLLTLKRVDIRAADREFVGILGPSGCGKSTLFNIISGLMLPDSGRVVIGGRDVTGCPGMVSYMRQKDLLLPSRNVLDNVCIPLLLKGVKLKEARQEAKRHLQTFGLAGFEHHYPAQLSGGMRQRAAMLRTYLYSSDVLLLDEPFASLDAITKRKMHGWLIAVFKELRPTVLFITHDVDEALQLCDRVYVLSECPTEVRLEVEVPSPRSSERARSGDRDLLSVKEAVLEALEIG